MVLCLLRVLGLVNFVRLGRQLLDATAGKPCTALDLAEMQAVREGVDTAQAMLLESSQMAVQTLVAFASEWAGAAVGAWVLTDPTVWACLAVPLMFAFQGPASPARRARCLPLTCLLRHPGHHLQSCWPTLGPLPCCRPLSARRWRTWRPPPATTPAQRPRR